MVGSMLLSFSKSVGDKLACDAEIEALKEAIRMVVASSWGCTHYFICYIDLNNVVKWFTNP